VESVASIPHAALCCSDRGVAPQEAARWESVQVAYIVNEGASRSRPQPGSDKPPTHDDRDEEQGMCVDVFEALLGIVSWLRADALRLMFLARSMLLRKVANCLDPRLVTVRDHQ
jgi:hypothetical protein